MKDNISLETFTLIAKAGIIMGQANPKKDINTLIKAMTNVLADQILKEQTND